MTKLKIARISSGNPGPVRTAAYVLLDPEIESFSYELANLDEILDGIASALELDRLELDRFAGETIEDPELTTELARHLRWRFDVKHHQPLGHRLGWYVLGRALKPATIVETGIHHGLGSLTLLRALHRNGEEGADGELISIDLNEDAGSLVRPAAGARWHRLTGYTSDLLAPALNGKRVALMIQDAAHTEENQRREFEAVLAHAASLTVLIDASGGWAPTLERLCHERGGNYHRIAVRSHAHVFAGLDLTFGIFRTGA